MVDIVENGDGGDENVVGNYENGDGDDDNGDDSIRISKLEHLWEKHLVSLLADVRIF